MTGEVKPARLRISLTPPLTAVAQDAEEAAISISALLSADVHRGRSLARAEVLAGALLDRDRGRVVSDPDLRHARILWIKTKMIPTRGMTISRMLGAATQYTGQKYTTRQAQQAHDDIGVWVQTMKSALPRREG